MQFLGFNNPKSRLCGSLINRLFTQYARGRIFDRVLVNRVIQFNFLDNIWIEIPLFPGEVWLGHQYMEWKGERPVQMEEKKNKSGWIK